MLTGLDDAVMKRQQYSGEVLTVFWQHVDDPFVIHQ